jgi:hypothetical protein
MTIAARARTEVPLVEADVLKVHGGLARARHCQLELFHAAQSRERREQLRAVFTRAGSAYPSQNARFSTENSRVRWCLKACFMVGCRSTPDKESWERRAAAAREKVAASGRLTSPRCCSGLGTLAILSDFTT